jgi:hypothetical protein
VSSQEYIATGGGSGSTDSATDGQAGRFDDLLGAAERMPGVTVKKVGSRYVVLEASEEGVAALNDQTGDKYQISPNSEIKLFE